jgi:prepilin-type N-terminal cleavage/methylation domain-containing protein
VRIQPRERGFTLVEIIVALTVLAMSILLISRAFLIILAVTNQGGNQTVASALAVRVLEQVRSGPEAQSNSAAWMSTFDTNVVAQGPTNFAAPYTNYAYQVMVNQVDLSPSTAYPCWLTSAPPSPCTPIPDHSNTIKWVTVRVTFRGQPLAQVGSALIRDMYHRP